MMYDLCAKIENKTVVDVIVCKDAEWASNGIGGEWLPVYEFNLCGIGWTWDGERFNPPEEVN